VRTYSNALTSYKNQSVRYKPTNMQGADTDVLVKTEIVQPGTKPIQLDYSLEKGSDGWKVYDVVVAGVSLVTNYRDTFNQEVRANGIDGLIQMLVSKNKQLDPAKK
jgi:phospholipid transport system substrate-binding protein